jgi:hypothetical protein
MNCQIVFIVSVVKINTISLNDNHLILKLLQQCNTARLSPPSPKFGGVKLGKRRTVSERGQTE